MKDYNIYASDDNIREQAYRKAEEFIQNESQFHLGFLPTEQAHPYTMNLSTVIQNDTGEGLRIILDVDRDLPSVARRIFMSKPFEDLCDAFERAARSHNRVCFSGCGSTGRLSMMLEEMWRQFWEDREGFNPGDAVRTENRSENSIRANQACSIMTGGDRALIRAVENFEDYEAFGARQVQDMDLQAGDLLIAITEGGETSSVIGTVKEGLARKCTVFLVFNNPASLLKDNLERCRQVIGNKDVTVLDLYTGAMALSGSTRMQATTMEMLVVGTAMEAGLTRAVQKQPSWIDFTSYANRFALLLKNLSSLECLKGMVQWAETEKQIYDRGGRITYLATEFLLDIFSDTTERSPTFMLPPFRALDDKTSPVSWAFAKNPQLKSRDAWIHMLRRPPRGLKWKKVDYLNMKAPEYAQKITPVLDEGEISRYPIGSEVDASRTEKEPFLFLHIQTDKRGHNPSLKNSERAGEKTLYIGKEKPDDADLFICLDIPGSPISLWHHLAIKLIINSVSTGTMAMMGRIRQNWMIQLDPTNKKLIDRGSRIISQLLNIPYSDACRELYISLLAREKFLLEGGETILSPVEAVLQRFSV